MPRAKKPTKKAQQIAGLLDRKKEIEAEIETIYRTAAREKWREHRDVCDAMAEILGAQIAGDDF